MLCSEVFDSLISLEMILNEVDITLFIDPLVGVGAITIHVSIAIWSSTIREKNGNLLKSLRAITPEVPSHVSILAISLRISLLAVDEIWELDRILDKEHWSVISNHIIVSLFSVKLNGESSGVSVSIC